METNVTYFVIAIVVMIILLIYYTYWKGRTSVKDVGYTLDFIVKGDTGRQETISLRTYAIEYHKQLLKGYRGECLGIELRCNGNFISNHNPEEYDDLIADVMRRGLI